jgi:hypothetical protein
VPAARRGYGGRAALVHRRLPAAGAAPAIPHAPRMDPTVPDDALVARGRRQLRLAAAALVAVGVLTIALALVRTAPGARAGELPGQAVRLALTVLLAWALARGHAWARWLTVAFVLLGMVTGAALFVTPDAFQPPQRGATLVVLAVFVTYAAVGITLAYSRGVRAVFRARRA